MKILAVIMATWLLAGCTSLMVGGTSGGGYPSGRDQRSAAVVASDSAITTKIKGKLAADPEVSVFAIGVRTWAGTVTLSGRVGSFAARDKAEAVAKGTSGVRAVNNLIIIEDRSAK